MDEQYDDMLHWLNAELQPDAPGPSKPGPNILETSQRPCESAQTTRPYPLLDTSEPSVQQPPPVRQHHSSAAMEKLDRQMTRLKEKNRRSATRYRGRQRELKQTVQQQVESLENQMRQMQVEQAALEARNRQLTAEVSCQGHQLQATAVAAVPASARACKHGCRDGWKEDHALQDRFGDLMQMTGTVTFSVRDPVLRLSVVQVAELPEAEREGLYQEYQKALASRLLQASASEESQRLVQLVYEACHVRLAMLAAAHKPGLDVTTLGSTSAAGFVAVHSDATAPASAPGANQAPEPMQPSAEQDPCVRSHSSLMQAAHSAKLTDQQRAAIVALHARNLLHVGLLADRQVALTAVLRDSVPTGCPEEPCDVRERFKQSLAAAAGLCEALRGTLTSNLEFNVLVWRRVLSARQVAFLTVSAWPAALETASLAEALAATEGAPSAADVTAAGPFQPTPLVEDVLPAADWPAWAAPVEAPPPPSASEPHNKPCCSHTH